MEFENNNYGNRTFWEKGYYVSMAGLNEKTIAKCSRARSRIPFAR